MTSRLLPLTDVLLGTHYQFLDTTSDDKRALFEFLTGELRGLLGVILAIIPEDERLGFLDLTCGLRANRDWQLLYLSYHQFHDLTKRLLVTRLSDPELRSWSNHYYYLMRHLFGVTHSPLLEQREHFRIPLVIPVNVFLRQGNRESQLTTYSRDVGLDGAAVYTPMQFEQVAATGLSLDFDDTVLRIACSLSWVSEDHLGLRFRSLGRKARLRLCDAVFAHVRELVYQRILVQGDA